MPYAVFNPVNVLLFTVKTVVVEDRDQAIIFLILGRKEALSLGFSEYLIDAKFVRKLLLVHEEASSSEANSCWRTKDNMRYAHQQQQTFHQTSDICSRHQIANFVLTP
ncbi:unnamed protein product [Sphagnum troendelagicum]|uniref:Uncharacterized protein n=1 Tax=Sphagnum troendelagicum TaxID=128251 RepID=A0ABP0V4M9_9BRYO